MTVVERIEKRFVAVAKLQKRFGKKGFPKHPCFAAAGSELVSEVAPHMAGDCSCQKRNLL